LEVPFFFAGRSLTAMLGNSLKVNRSKVFLIVVALAVAVFGALSFRYSRRMNHDAFSAHLAALAGTNALYCGIAKDVKASPSDGTHRAMAAAFSAGQSFWAREERHYIHIHSTTEWDVSVGFVYTSQGGMLRLERYPPTFLRAAVINEYRIASPTVHVDADGRQYLDLDFDEKVFVSAYTLDP
jgi:hypothetical protein